MIKLTPQQQSSEDLYLENQKLKIILKQVLDICRCKSSLPILKWCTLKKEIEEIVCNK